jgi:hypothetical protein
MASLAVLSSAFNTQLTEFVEDMLRIFPESVDLQTAKNSIATIRKTNPRIISTAWHKYVTIPYAAKIDEGDLAYFLEKDYNSDLVNISSATGDPHGKIAGIIDRLRTPIKEMGSENHRMVLKFLQNLTKLTTMINAAK